MKQRSPILSNSHFFSANGITKSLITQIFSAIKVIKTSACRMIYVAFFC